MELSDYGIFLCLAVLPGFVTSSNSTTTSSGDSSADFPKILTPIIITIAGVIVSLIVAKLVSMCTEKRKEKDEHSVEIDDHTKKLVRARLIIIQMKRKEMAKNNPALGFFRRWSTKTKISKGLKDKCEKEKSVVINVEEAPPSEKNEVTVIESKGTRKGFLKQNKVANGIPDLIQNKSDKNSGKSEKVVTVPDIGVQLSTAKDQTPPVNKKVPQSSVIKDQTPPANKKVLQPSVNKDQTPPANKKVSQTSDDKNSTPTVSEQPPKSECVKQEQTTTKSSAKSEPKSEDVLCKTDQTPGKSDQSSTKSVQTPTKPDQSSAKLVQTPTKPAQSPTNTGQPHPQQGQASPKLTNTKINVSPVKDSNNTEKNGGGDTKKSSKVVTFNEKVQVKTEDELESKQTEDPSTVGVNKPSNLKKTS